MAKERKPQAALLILAGIGAGVVAGAIIGIILAQRKRDESTIAETVDDLRHKAERVLHELSDSVSELKETTQRITADMATAVDSTVDVVRN
jgi:gas vesicle protein